MFVLAFCLSGAGCSTHSKKPVEVEPVMIPASRILTLSQEQLLFLDWHLA
jgi:hypothetical protein